MLQSEPKELLHFFWNNVENKFVGEKLADLANLTIEDATWANLADLNKWFPHLNFEDKDNFKGRGNGSTRSGQTKQRRSARDPAIW